MKCFLSMILFFFSIVNVYCQDTNSSISKMPFQLSFIYPIGTSGFDVHNHCYTYSFNILAGRTGGVDGIELGGLINLNDQLTKGFQAAGIGNVSLGKGEAFQAAGIFNVVRNNFKGFQGAGITNTVGGNVNGTQVAGIINVALDSVRGGQVAGIFNAALKIKGYQIAGIANIAHTVKGVQLAGILNICDSIDGVPVALVSYVHKNGYKKIEVSTDGTTDLSLTLKTGVRKFYTLFTTGTAFNKEYNMTIGAGAGTSILMPGANSAIDIELRSSQLTKNYRIYGTLIKNSLIVDYSLIVFNRIELFAGPSFNMLISDQALEAAKAAPQWARALKSNNNIWGWVGFHGGIRF